MADDPDVRHNPDRRRYDLYVEGEWAGEATYRMQGNTVVFDHTEVDPAQRSEGLAGVMVRYAVEDARQRGHNVRGACSYVAAYLREERSSA